MRLAFSAGLLWVPQGSKSARYNVHERGGANFVYSPPLSSVDATTRQLATNRPGGLDAYFGRLAAGSQAREQSAKADEVFGNDEVENTYRIEGRKEMVPCNPTCFPRYGCTGAWRRESGHGLQQKGKLNKPLPFFKRTCILTSLVPLEFIV